MGAYRYIRISRQRGEIELQSTDELAFTQLIAALSSKSTCQVRLPSSKSPYPLSHHCHFSGSDKHVERAWKLIADRLSAEGWVRLDEPVATRSQDDALMYFGIPPAKVVPVSLPRH
jgi:hypothetical protein